MSQLQNSLKEQRRQSFNSTFATLSAILSIGHFIVLGNSISWAQGANDLYQVFTKGYPSKFLVHINIPFATEVAFLATVQLVSSLAILSFNRKPEMATYMHYASLMALLSSFAASATVCTTAIYYTKQIADLTKIQYLFAGPQGFYRWLEIDAAANCLISIPFLFFIFYNNIDAHLARQKMTVQPLIKSHKWIFVLLLNAAAHALFVYLVYSFISQQDSDASSNNYQWETDLSCYMFFIMAEIAVSMGAFIALNLHFQPLPFGKSHLFKTWMSTKHLIVATTIPILFSFTVIMMIVNKGSQLVIDEVTNGNNPNICFFLVKCSSRMGLIIQCFTFLGLTLGPISVLLAKFRDFSGYISSEQGSDKLLTTDYDGDHM